MGKRFFLILFVLHALGPASSASADAASLTAPETLRWRCWYDQSVHISCLIEYLAETAPDANTRNPYTPDENLPPVIRSLRTNPENFRQRIIRIPLHAPPVEMEFAARLARAVVCGSRPGCSVHFTASPPTDSEIVETLERQGDEAIRGGGH